MDTLIGTIMPWAGNYPPSGWAFCNGQQLNIQQNAALYGVLGATYGGDKKTVFNLPNLQGYVSMHFGTGPGLTTRVLAQPVGASQVTLTSAQIPPHTHTATAYSGTGNSNNPTSCIPASTGNATSTTTDPAFAAASNGSLMNVGFITGGGGNQGHENRQPTIYVNFIIALIGYFPMRN